MKYTKEDVLLAVDAQQTMQCLEVEGCTAESWIRSFIDMKENPELYEEGVEEFYKGKKILEEARILWARDRTTIPYLSNGRVYHEFKDADSPIVLIPSGYIATSQSYIAAALKEK